MKSSESNREPNNVLCRIQRGLAGYVSYLAACEMNQAFSEYVLYEPMLRILTARGYMVKCESRCDELPRHAGGGDYKRIDFEVTRIDPPPPLRFALEVKWAKRATLDVKQDYEKLATFHKVVPAPRSFLCVFGRKSHIQNLRLQNGSFVELDKPVYAEFGITRFGCRIYEISAG